MNMNHTASMKDKPDDSGYFPSIYSKYFEIPSSTVIVSTVIAVWAVYYIYYQIQRKQKLPPGPLTIPVLGCLPGWVDNLATTACAMQKSYGDIFSLRIGVYDLVMLANPAMIKSALTKKTLQGRTQFITFKSVTYNRNIGLINSEGDAWATGRKFALRSLFDSGLNKKNMETHIQHEACKLVEFIDSLNGEPVVLGAEMNVAILNIIWSLVASRRYNITDPEINEFILLLDNMVTIFEGRINVLNFMPWLRRFLPGFVLKYLDVYKLEESTDQIYKFTKDVIDMHEKDFNKNNTPVDYIDHYLLQIEEQKDDPDTHFSSDKMDLQASIIDLFFAGSETTSSTLKWFLQYMAQNPEVQEKITTSIDEVIPRANQPQLDDKPKLPYLEAAINETLRLSSLIPQGLPHVATADTIIAGYTIPKGTIVAACLQVSHRSSSAWESPDEFRLEHMLNDEGQVKTNAAFMPFSVGNRQCLGEHLAKWELFLMTATILQNFTIEKGPNFEKNLNVHTRKSNLFNMPPAVDLILRKRPLPN